MSSGSASPSDPGALERRPARRVRCRWAAPSAKLPKMTNSERGKFYRKKYKDYELALERSTAALRRDVQELQLLVQLARALPAPGDGGPPVDRAAVLRAVQRHMDALRTVPLASYRGQTFVERHRAAGAALDFRVRRVRLVSAAGDAPVVALYGTATAVYQGRAAAQLFPRLRSPAALVGREVEYPCAHLLRFGDDGTLLGAAMDVDEVAPLLEALRSIEDVAAALGSTARDQTAREQIAVGEQIALPGLDELLGVGRRATGVRRARPPAMAMDFILS